MRMLLNVTFPEEPFNTAVRNGTAGKTIGKILSTIKPEAAYFTEQDGHRGGTLVINMENASQIPSFAEPWYLSFNATCKFTIAMTPEDLQKSNIETLGKTWS